jgi:hypothetical protein
MISTNKKNKLIADIINSSLNRPIISRKRRKDKKIKK